MSILILKIQNKDKIRRGIKAIVIHKLIRFTMIRGGLILGCQQAH